MAGINHCLTAAAKALQGISRDELNQYASDVLNLARKYQQEEDMSAPASIERAQEEIGDERLKESFEIAQIKFNDMTKLDAKAKLIKEKKKNVRELLGRMYRGQGDNVESAQRGLVDNFSRMIFDSLSPDEIKWFTDKNNEMDIAAAMDGERSSPDAAKIANLLRKYMDERNFKTAQSGVLPLAFMRGDRWLKAVHSAEKLMSGGEKNLTRLTNFVGRKYSAEDFKNQWMTYIKQKLDIQKTFEKTNALGLEGKISNEKVNDILSSIYDNITTGKTNVLTNSELINSAEEMAKRGRMFFIWKDFKSLTEYNGKYGTGDLFSATMADIHASGRRIGMSQVLGSTPLSAFGKLKEVQQKAAHKSGTWMRNTELTFQVLSGDSTSVVSPTLANNFGNLRSLTSMGRLGILAVQSLNDYSIAASYSARMFNNYGEALFNQLDNVFRQASNDEERKTVARLFRSNLQNHMGYMGKVADAQNVGALTSKLTTGFYRATLMHAHDVGNRMGIMSMMSRGLGDAAKMSFDKLTPQLQKQLTKFDILPEEWNVARKYNQGRLFTTDNVNAIPQNELRDLWNQDKQGYTLGEYRDVLYRKVYSLFDVASNDSILTPNAFMKGILNQGSKPGTWLGEGLRTITQFKTYPATYIDRVLIHGWKDADGVQAKLGWALQNFGYVLPMSAASTYLSYIINNQFPHPSQMSASEKLYFYSSIAMPAIGILSSILNPNNQNQGLVGNLLASPTLKLIGNTASTALSLAEGNPQNALKNAKNALNYLPGATFPGRGFITQFLGDDAQQEPGVSPIIS